MQSDRIDASKFSYYYKTDENLIEESNKLNINFNHIQIHTNNEEEFQKHFLNIYSLDYTLYQQILNQCSFGLYLFSILINQFCVNMIYGFHITVIWNNHDSLHTTHRV